MKTWIHDQIVKQHMHPAMIIGYPAITADEYVYVGSIRKVSGAKMGSKEYAWFSHQYNARWMEWSITWLNMMACKKGAVAN